MSVRQSNGSSLRQLVKQIHDAGGDAGRKAINESLAAESLRLVKRGFERSEDPYGHAWPPPVLRDGKPLLNTGRLRNGFIPRSTPRTVELWNNVKYAAANNYGATIHAKEAPYLIFKTPDGFAMKKTVVLPARQMVPDAAKGLPPAWYQSMVVVADRVLRQRVTGVK